MSYLPPIRPPFPEVMNKQEKKPAPIFPECSNHGFNTSFVDLMDEILTRDKKKKKKDGLFR